MVLKKTVDSVEWTNKILEEEKNFKVEQTSMRNGTGDCTPLGTLFAVKTTAVISPNTGKEAIIIEYKQAVRIHTCAHTHTYTKACSHTA